MKLALIGVMGFLLMGCATKMKCVDIQMMAEDSRMSFQTPSTGWMSVDLGTINLEGMNRYRSCPVGEDPKWMTTVPPMVVP